jgi:hypothetical protein
MPIKAGADTGDEFFMRIPFGSGLFSLRLK